MLRKLFSLTEQGAKDLKKGIIASVFTSLSLMLPMGLLLMLVMRDYPKVCVNLLHGVE